MERHLLYKGIRLDYTTWCCHGIIRKSNSDSDGDNDDGDCYSDQGEIKKSTSCFGFICSLHESTYHAALYLIQRINAAGTTGF